MANDKKHIPARVTSDELAMVPNNILEEKQLRFLLKATPEEHIYQRKAKGGGTWDYVTGAYVKKVLNLMFGWDWSFEVKDHKFDLQIGQAYVLGKLTVTSNGRTITKEQFGRVDVKFKNDWVENPNEPGKKMKQKSDIPLDLGNDLKAATTDALKKCAAELGVAADIYSADEFRPVKIISNDDRLTELKELFDFHEENLPPEEAMNIERIIKEKEEASYKKAIRLLTKMNK